MNESAPLLIIDDCKADRLLYRRLLTNHSKEISLIDEVENYESALEYLEHKTPCCCLIDYSLPGLDGLALLKSLRRIHPAANIPVIILTGHGDEALAVDMMQNGAQDYIIKSDITAERLYRSIKNAIHTCDLQRQLHHLAHYDSLTGLLNRNLFLNRLKKTLDYCNRYESQCALLFVDLDAFKQVNDGLGHHVGDFILKTVADRIRKNCRQTDSAARFGGDEFVVLLDRIDAPTSHYTAQKILKAVEEPFKLNDQIIQISASIGLAHYPNCVTDVDELIRQADQALYEAKRKGRARYVKFSDKLKKKWERKQNLEHTLPGTIKNGDLSLVFQPIVNVNTTSIYSFEALSRWHHNNYDVSASELINLVDGLGMMEPFHEWLFDTALHQLSEWQKQYNTIQLCINIPANHCHSNWMVSCLSNAIQRHCVPPSSIELEITETNLMNDQALSVRLLDKLHEQGIRIAIDDFGTGYSSMAYLTQLPIDTLKIDQHFFINMEADCRNQKVIQAVTNLGHSLGLKVIAEGVETEKSLQMAVKANCDYIQGYYIGSPQPAVDNLNAFYLQFPGLDVYSKALS